MHPAESTMIPQMDGPSEPGWREACLRYFVKKYNQRILNRSQEPFEKFFQAPAVDLRDKYPLPATLLDDKIMQYLLNDRLFYLALRIMSGLEMDFGVNYAMLLWEMFGTDSGYLLEIYLWMQSFGANSSYLDRFVREHLLSIPHVEDFEGTRTFEIFLSRIRERLNVPSVHASIRDKLKLWEKRLLELKDELCLYGLGIAWDNIFVGLPYPSSQFSILPLWTGLQYFLERSQDSLFESVVKCSLEHLPPLCDFEFPTRGVGYRERKEWIFTSISKHTTVLFDTAGTGKTVAVHDLIQDTVGFYCLSPNLPPSNTTPLNWVVTPDRACASRDTYSMYDDFKALDELHLESRSWSTTKEHHQTFHDPFQTVEALFLARNLIRTTFNQIMSQRSGDHRERRLKWLQLQISCWPENDPFDVAYRFARLRGSIDHLREPIKGDFWAIDEAQHALEDPLARVLLEQMLKRRSLINYLSGTSLELNEMSAYLEEQDSQIERIRPPQEARVLNYEGFRKILCHHAWRIIKELCALQSRKDPTRTSEKFPLLSRGGKPLGFTMKLPEGNWKNVECLLRQWYVFRLDGDGSEQFREEQFREEQFREFLSQVKRSHSIFLGRPRWTTLFAEELLKVSSTTEGRLMAQDVENAAKEAAKKIKKSLKHQITRMKDTHYRDELYWTAIEADVYSMNRIFPDENSVKYIADGFALVTDVDVIVDRNGNSLESEVSKGRLQEPLALEAVMEYLRDQKPDSKDGCAYEKLIHRFFANLQFDRSKGGGGGGLGKMAEFAFASKLDLILQQSEDKSEDEITKHRRNMFLNIVEDAQGQSSATTLGKEIPNLRDYVLVNLPILGPLDVSITSKEFFRSRPSKFLFPDTQEGPDLYFFLDEPGTSHCILEEPGTSHRILFVISFKTGAEKPGQKSYIQDALDTLVLKPRDVTSFPPNISIVHIYIASVVDIKESNFNNWDRSKLQQNQFICYMDRQRSKDVWGETFETLLELMKGVHKHKKPRGVFTEVQKA